MPLEEYRRKRDFAATPEPAGAGTERGPGAARRIFVVQKHAASRLHYDFRLELDGVLLSWAVPKGPSFDPHDKRLAVHVEDHPLDYASFEGVIPAGEYGAGRVIVWDRGTWEPVGEVAGSAPSGGARASGVGDVDPHATLAKGDLKFVLHGDKLIGRWVLVRMKPRAGERAENWLLIKERDEHARPASEYDVLAARPESVASGRTIEQVTDEPTGPETQATAPAATASLPAGNDPIPLDAPMQLATLVDEAPVGDDWIHEAKYDGYRLRAAVQLRTVRLLTRNGLDWTDRLAPVAEALSTLPVDSALLDGELVAFDTNGISDFGALQDALATGALGRLAYVAFDLLYLDGHDLRAQPLLARKDLLRTVLASVPPAGVVRYADHVRGSGSEFHRQACDLALEGSVAKLADRPWVPGRSPDWRKVKCSASQEFVVGGFTEPGGSRHGFGALLLGVYGSDGVLRYAGRVGTGFKERELAEVRVRLDSILTEDSPFSPAPRIPGHTVRWVRPELVVDVSFREWTRDGVIRQPSYRGLRPDKDPREVSVEVAGAAGADARPGGSGAPRSTTRRTPSNRTSGRTEYGAPVEVAGVTITNPEKPLFPNTDLTKLELARYYERIAPVMVPHVANRPLTLVRCPLGHGRSCFYQKHPDDGLPLQLRTVELEERDGPATYFFLEDAAGLVPLAQMGALELHTWGSRVGDPERPDRLVFDLDPGPGVLWERVVETAVLLRERLTDLGFTPFVKTTGGKGLHVVIPVEPSLRYDAARAWTKAFVNSLVAEDPATLTGKMAKRHRPGRVFIDYVRNSHGATAVAPYSTRARPGAPVSVPVEWEELTTGLDPAAFTPVAVLDRMERLDWRDPWVGIDSAQASSRTLQAAASASS